MDYQVLKKVVFRLICSIAIGVFLSFGLAYAEDEPNYVPNEIIVKFKPETAATIEREVVQKKQAIGRAKLSPSLDDLNKKHKVKKYDQIFKGFKKGLAKAEALKSKNEKLLTREEKRLLNRLKRVPKDAKKPDLDGIYKVELEQGQSVPEAVAEYSKDPNVEYAQPNYIYQICATPLPQAPYIPNDYYIEDNGNPGYWREASWGQAYPDMWGLQKIQAIEAWNIFDVNHNGAIDAQEKLPGEGIIVAVIDTGADYNHEDLRGNIWANEYEIPDNGIDDDGNGYVDDTRGWDFVSNDNEPMDGHGHGTHCAGTIAAKGDNEIGVIGIAPQAKIMPVKGLSDSGSGSTEGLAQCIVYASDNGADVLSNSWGSYVRKPSDPISEAAVDYAYANGCVVVFAAGNSNDDVAYYSPSNYSKVIAVSAIDNQDQKASFSNWGGLIAVAAPGVNVLSLRASDTDMYKDRTHIIDQKYYFASGTSMACPHVAGLAALVLSSYPMLTNEEIKQVICDSAYDIGEPEFDIYYGHGRVNAYQAVISAPTASGSIYLNKAYYAAPSEVIITVMDTDLNIDGEINETVTVRIKSSTETFPEETVLTETGADSSVFVGSVYIEPGTAPEAGDGVLVVRHNDAITATYMESNPEGEREASAIVDLIGPAIGTVESHPNDIEIGGGGTATITWDTDEPSMGIVYYGIKGADPSVFSSVITSAYTTFHSFTVKELEVNKVYTFYVESKDRVGNTTCSDNGGNFYEFIILPPDIGMEPSGFSLEALEHSSPFSRTLRISNTAGPDSMDLLFDIPDPSQGWLLLSAQNGRIAPGSSMDINVTVNPKALAGGEYTGEIIIYNNALIGSSAVVPIQLTCIVSPTLGYRKYYITDDNSGGSYNGNANKQLNPGERAELRIELKNSGSLPAVDSHASLSLTAADAYVTIVDDSIILGDVPAYSTILSPDSFLIEASGDTPDRHTVTFALDITDSSGRLWHTEFPLTVTAPFTGPSANNITLDIGVPSGVSVGNPKICSDENGDVYVVWSDNRNGNSDVYFNHSVDFGATWQEKNIRIDTDAPGSWNSVNPSIACDNSGHVYVAWYDLRDGGHSLLFNVSDDYGATWQPKDFIIATVPSAEIPEWAQVRSEICADNNNHVYVLWGSDYEPVSFGGVTVSSDNGITWKPGSIQMSGDHITCDEEGRIYISLTDGGSLPYRFSYSPDYGTSWQHVGYMESGNGYRHGIAQDGTGYIYAGWTRYYKYGQYYVGDTICNISDDYVPRVDQSTGVKISSNTYPYKKDVQLSCNNRGRVYGAWVDINGLCFSRSANRGENGQIISGFKTSGYNSFLITSNDCGYVYVTHKGGLVYSINQGTTWGTEIKVSDPVISCDDSGYGYLAWHGSAGEEENIYFKPIFHAVANVPPFVKVISPNGGETWSGYKEIQYFVDDADTDTLSASAYYRKGTSAWTLIASNIPTQKGLNSCTWDTSLAANSTGYEIKVVVSDGTASTAERSDEPFNINNNNTPPEIGSVSVSPETAYVSSVLTAQYIAWQDPDGPAVNPFYQWYVNNTALAGEMSNKLACSGLDGGDEVYCVITPNDTLNSGNPKESNHITLQNRVPSVNIISPDGGEIWSGAGAIRWISSDSDNDTLTNSIFYSKDGADWQLIGSEAFPTGWTLISEEYSGIHAVGTYKVDGKSAPAFCDIDADGDYDLFVGSSWSNYLLFYANDGTPHSPIWTRVSEQYVPVGAESMPAFCDIDSDGDYDMFVRDLSGLITFYRNDGMPRLPNWTRVTTAYNGINGCNSAPAFCDIDSDGDYDMLIGKDGAMVFYRNDGTPEEPNWTLLAGAYYEMGKGVPTFCDIDSDGDYDIFIGRSDGTVAFYRNDGTPEEPDWILVATAYNTIGVGKSSVPAFCDIDSDGDYDMFVGKNEGSITFYTNEWMHSWVWDTTAVEDSDQHKIKVEASDRVSSSSDESSGFFTIYNHPIPPPAAGFAFDPAEGEVPLTVRFTDASTGIIAGRFWSFGDGSTSAEQNPTHTYNNAGIYTVSLEVKNLGGRDTEQKPDCINVTFGGSITDVSSDDDDVMETDTFSLHAEFTPGYFDSYAWLSDDVEFISGSIDHGQAVINTEVNAGILTPGMHRIRFKAANSALGIEVLSEPLIIMVARDGQVIQDAIDEAQSGATVQIPAGSYILSSDLNITKNINLVGIEGAANTTLCLGPYRIYVRDPLTYTKNEYYYALLANLTDVTIGGFTIIGYTGTSREGAIQNYSKKLTLENCKVVYNQGVKVGAIYSCYGSQLVLENTVVAKNANLLAANMADYGFWYSGYWCGTIYLKGCASLIATNSTIADNINNSDSAQVKYGAVYRDYMNALYFTNSIMWNNGVGAQDFLHRDIRQMEGSVSITYSDIQSTSVYETAVYLTQAYKDTYLPGVWVPGAYDPVLYMLDASHNDINQDPQFIEPWGLNYNIGPESPCKGTGEGLTDMGAKFE